MNDRTDIEHVLRHWFGDGPEAMPDRVVDVVADRIGHSRQQSAWRVAWRQITMNAYAKTIVGAAAVLIVAVLGYTVFTIGAGTAGGPTPTAQAVPSTTPAPSTTPIADARPPIPEVALAGALPDGWGLKGPATWNGTLNIALAFNTTEGPEMLIEIMPNRSVMRADCAHEPEPGVGTTAAEIIGALSARPGLVADTSSPVTIGGLPGVQVDIEPDQTSTGFTCRGEGEAYVPLLGYYAGPDWLFNSIGDVGRYRLIALDAPNGANAVIAIYSEDSATFDRHLEDAMGIVESLEFDT
jgi:hypothetical protein